MADPAAQGIIGLYERHAQDWDADRGRDLIERHWLDRFLGALRPGGGVLDVGCGSGEPIARYLIERGVRVTGLDSSPSLIELCRARFPEAHWPQVHWVVGDMRTTDVGVFDAVIAWHSLFHLTPEDQRLMFPLWSRQCASGAALMFTSGSALGESIGQWRGEPLYHGSLDEAEYRSLLEANGFEVIEHGRDDPECGGATVWLSRKV